MVGWFAKSKAGHDQDQVYVIIKETKEYVYLSDGKLKPLERPKQKNKKHIQIIKQIGEGITLDDAGTLNPKVRNEDIKRAIKLYLFEEPGR